MATDFIVTTFNNQVNATASNPLKDSFSFNGTALQTIPDEIQKLAERIVILDVAKNRISSLPPCLAQFGLLTTLRLRGNALVNIPEGIFAGMKVLSELDMVDNELEALPSDLGELGALERLVLTGNRLTSLPPSITSLVSLRELLLGENLLTSLPDDINALKSLEKLEVHENQLTALPANITLCSTLRSLSFQSNQITVLPDKMWLLESLGGLHMHENLFDESVIPQKLLSKRAKAILSYLLAVSEERTDDATEILEYSVSVPVKQKSVSRLQRGGSMIEAKPTLNREQSAVGGTKAPPSPRHEGPTGVVVASEIPSGIVSRASMSLRRASTIVDTKEEKSAISSRGPRPSGKSVLSRAPSQVTEAAHSPHSSGPNTPVSGRTRPQSVAIAPNNTISPRPGVAKVGPKVGAVTPTRPKSPMTGHSKVPSTGTNGTSVPTAVGGASAKAPAVPAKPNANRPSTLRLKVSNDMSAKPDANPADKVGIEPKPNDDQIPLKPNAVKPIKPAKPTVDDANVGKPSPDTKTASSDESTSHTTSTGAPEELSFEFVQPAEPLEPVVTDGADLFVEPVLTPSATPPLASSGVSTPTATARLTVEDAKPLIMRENSIPVPDPTDTAGFVFEDAPTQPPTASPDGPEAQPQDNDGSEPAIVPELGVAAAQQQVSPRQKSPKVKPDVPSKKPSKRAKPQAEIVPTAEPTPTLSPTNSTNDPIAIRGRAKTRKIIGGDLSVGTPFYSSSDMAYLPRKIQNVPLMRLTSKRFLMSSRMNSQVAWKDMFSPDNLTLMSSGAYVGYADHFQNEDHVNFVGEDRIDGGAIIVSLLKKATADTDINCIIRTKDGDTALLIPIPDKKPKDNAGWLSLLKQNQDFAAVVPKKVALRPMVSPQAPTQLAELESKLHRPFFKFGIVYCKEGQTEEEDYLANEQGSPEFEEFLRFIGDKIQLQGWTKFDGGLDTQKNSTGTHSVYTEWKDLSIMFHVSTLLPMLPKSGEVEDSDQEKEDRTQEKKVHIGNDIVLIVFLEGETADTTFNPRKFVSHFNHAFIVINPVRQKGLTLYRVNTIYKSDVQPCLPSIPADAIFEKSDRFRDLLLTKLVNSERSACLGEQFAQSLASLRFHKLHLLATSNLPQSSGSCFAGCAGKK